MSLAPGLRWRVEGSGRGVVLVHGWALGLDYWDPVVPQLAAHSRVLRFDRRGFGHSAGSPSLDADCRDLIALMRLEGITRATLIGMSQGARVAVAAALAYPEHIDALVLDGAPWLAAAGAASSEAKEDELPLRRLRTLLQQEGEAALQRAVLELPLMKLHTSLASSHAVLTRCVGNYRGTDLADAMRVQQALALGDLRQSVLVVNGALDTPRRLEAGQRLKQQIKGSHRTLLENAGHLAALDAPDEYGRVVVKFLERVPAK